MAPTRQPEDSRVTDIRVGRWDALLPSDGKWTNLVGRSSERDEFIKRLRQLADFLEARPEIPVPPPYATITINVFAEGTDAEKVAQVDYASTLLDAPVTDGTSADGHYITGIGFGCLEYRFVAIPAKPAERAANNPVSVTPAPRISRTAPAKPGPRRGVR
ncbi:MAG: hypothetical protein JO345_02015 [Streptosporangiaceae bacterium]|nr:hypothetical protein [Streptosporangiaceae bacterium]